MYTTQSRVRFEEAVQRAVVKVSDKVGRNRLSIDPRGQIENGTIAYRQASLKVGHTVD